MAWCSLESRVLCGAVSNNRLASDEEEDKDEEEELENQFWCEGTTVHFKALQETTTTSATKVRRNPRMRDGLSFLRM